MQFLIKYLSRFKAFCFSKKSIVVFVGSKGTFLAAFTNETLSKNLFIPFEDRANIKLYEEFFNQFSNSHVFFLLDDSECKMRHDLIPVLQSLVKNNPVENFINEYFNQDDIVGYYVYDIVTKPSETWHTILVSTPYQSPIKELLDCAIGNKSVKFGGAYFLDLEIKPIIDRTLSYSESEQFADHFQICVFVLNASGIKLVVKYLGNVISIGTFECPKDKSESYTQGIIEQEVNECLLTSKKYINNLGLKVAIIIFGVEPELQVLLKKSNFENHKVIFLPASITGDSLKVSDERFSDSLLSYLFIKYKSFLAFNNYLKVITKLNFIKSLLFKPLMIAIIILFSVACIIKYKTFLNYQELLALNSKYYATEQEYNNLKREYPYIQNATSLVDLYILEKLLHSSSSEPFNLLESIITNLDSDFKISEITWKILNVDQLLLASEQKIRIDMLLKFAVENLSLNKATEELNNRIQKLRNILHDLNINTVIFTSKIINLPSRIVIPLYISIMN